MYYYRKLNSLQNIQLSKKYVPIKSEVVIIILLEKILMYVLHICDLKVKNPVTKHGYSG